MHLLQGGRQQTDGHAVGDLNMRNPLADVDIDDFADEAAIGHNLVADMQGADEFLLVAEGALLGKDEHRPVSAQDQRQNGKHKCKFHHGPFPVRFEPLIL